MLKHTDFDMSLSIHSFLMGFATFSTTYTIVRFISYLAGLPHIGMIILIFVASLLAFYSRDAVGRLIATIYLTATVVISYLVHLYFEYGVKLYQFPWPYERNVKNNVDSSELLNMILFQKSEASFVILVIASVVAIYFYLKLSKVGLARNSQSSVVIGS